MICFLSLFDILQLYLQHSFSHTSVIFSPRLYIHCLIALCPYNYSILAYCLFYMEHIIGFPHSAGMPFDSHILHISPCMLLCSSSSAYFTSSAYMLCIPGLLFLRSFTAAITSSNVGGCICSCCSSVSGSEVECKFSCCWEFSSSEKYSLHRSMISCSSLKVSPFTATI